MFVHILNFGDVMKQETRLPKPMRKPKCMPPAFSKQKPLEENKNRRSKLDTFPRGGSLAR